ncbi:uncharacterized protein [Battus philenor]|uniref:uncharacterized protein n=1 Tax=Battus philenor TaxID=42288 RepID=UPI0035CFCA55
MNRYNENYYLRKCYLEREQVPTQSVMKNVMSPALAKVYFTSMAPKLKVLAGLEPPLKGGGYDWYAPPEDLLKGKTVLKPLKKEFLLKLGFSGFEYYGETILQQHLKSQEEEKRKALLENDKQWKRRIEEMSKKHYEEFSKKLIQKNSEKIRQAFSEFTVLYSSSINKIEGLLLNAAMKEIKRVRDEAHLQMTNHYKTLLQQQATMLYDRYTEKLERKKEELKQQFIRKVEESQKELACTIHDTNVEKHIAIEKLRQLLECQNLACQIYVAMKEREESEKLLSQSIYEHKKVVKLLTAEIARNEIQIQSEKEKEEKRQEFNRTWKEKVSAVVKKFQEFIAYSLHTIPEQTDFLLNIEKLMLLQVSDIIEDPNAESLFEPEKEEFHTPVPELRPFYLFCDEGTKPAVNTELCLKPYRSSMSQMPVIVINERCLYAACDNLEQFVDKVEQFVDVERSMKLDVNDSRDYTYDVPVKYTESQQLLDLKEQSSVMQILQKEIPNPKDVHAECFCKCKLPYCFCPCNTLHCYCLPPLNLIEQKSEPISPQISLPVLELSKTEELMHSREPKWENYFKFMEPKKCKCAKLAKKGLEENLPAYMRKMSEFEYPELLNYEPCSVRTLKKLVKRAKGKAKRTTQAKTAESTKKDAAMQYSDQEFEFLCTCFDEIQAERIINQIMEKVTQFSEVNTRFNIDGSISPDHLNQPVEYFVRDRASSLRNLIKDSPELKEIFRKEI